jgi:hypothetical protein
VEGEFAALPNSLKVRVLDISATGVMLATTRPVELGTRGQLRLNLDGTPFTTDVEIQRVSTAPGVAAGYVVGASFVGTDAAHQQTLERFINQ